LFIDEQVIANMTYHKIERGLGKKDIQIVPTRCRSCGASGTTLYAVIKRGKKTYVCGKHRELNVPLI